MVFVRWLVAVKAERKVQEPVEQVKLAEAYKRAVSAYTWPVQPAGQARVVRPQSWPENPSSHTHRSPSHRPCPLQLCAHAASTRPQLGPVKPRSHTQLLCVELKVVQRPWPEQPWRQSDAAATATKQDKTASICSRCATKSDISARPCSLS